MRCRFAKRSIESRPPTDLGQIMTSSQRRLSPACGDDRASLLGARVRCERWHAVRRRCWGGSWQVARIPVVTDQRRRNPNPLRLCRNKNFHRGATTRSCAAWPFLANILWVTERGISYCDRTCRASHSWRAFASSSARSFSSGKMEWTPPSLRGGGHD